MQSEELYSGHGWRVSLDEAPLPDGRVKKAARVSRCDTVHILAFTSKTTVLLLKEYRPFLGGFIWMLPTGRVNKEHDLHVAAQRELQEETGYRAEKLELYATCHHSETFGSSNHIFLAHGVTKDPLPADPDEMMEVHDLPLTEAITNVLGCTSVHAPSAYALLRYEREMRT